MTRRPALTAALLVLVLALATLALSAGLTQASTHGGTQPDRAWDAPVLVDGGGKSGRETSLAISPTDPDVMFTCIPSGVPSTGNGQSYFHRSLDGGDTWAHIDVEGGTGDTRNQAFEGGDCDVRIGPDGTIYTADTWLGNLSVGHSTDDGETWDGTALSVSTPIVDRPWLEPGEAPGELFLSYQNLQCCMQSAIWFTKSTDYGMTFRPAVPITTADESGLFTWEGNLVAAPGGQDLYLPYTRRNAAPLVTGIDGTYTELVYVAHSHDGGLTWTSTLVHETDRPASFLYPSLALGDDGTLHLVYASRRPAEQDQPIWYATSGDKAQTWTTPTPISAGTAGVAPWVVTDEAGDALVMWLGSTDGRATTSSESPWWLHWGRITPEGDITWGTTTEDPLFEGRQTMPEFNTLRVDADGMVHIGASVMQATDNGGRRWVTYYQRERLIPETP